MENLIFDRTQEDVDNLTNKGKYRYTDLNRVEQWCEYLANELTNYSYLVSIVTKTNWTMNDRATPLEMERIRSNVAKIKEAYLSFSSVPDSLEYMTIQKANDIEKVLYEIDGLLDKMPSTFYYSGEKYCGEV